MATLTSAQLTAAITANQVTFGIQNVTTPVGSPGFPAVGIIATPQLPIVIDQEVMWCVQQPVSGTILVRGRGAEGTTAQPHDALSNVYIGTAFDMGAPSVGAFGFFDPNLPYVLSIGSATYTVNFNVPGNLTFNINTTGGAAAITLPAPLLSMNGTTYTFTSNTANGHVITATNLIQSGQGTQPHSTITFAAIIGAGLILTAENGFWNVPSPSATVTIS
jgi:hypothetical protein